jgi:hypothetical protein
VGALLSDGLHSDCCMHRTTRCGRVDVSTNLNDAREVIHVSTPRASVRALRCVRLSLTPFCFNAVVAYSQQHKRAQWERREGEDGGHL